ncbi:hypothetical protein RND71_028974 [Anisodus tanguticus]|uniref:Uncharacterized protein n=1 Tax=Anisodus tanguticus TaxID=243964 RepID=A0AAE1V7L1_9SOLA|nr:hypothetical protein RND71_028974 [Anisodus tanguticus]
MGVQIGRNLLSCYGSSELRMYYFISHMKKSIPKNTDGTGSSTLVKKEGKVDKDSIREEHIGALREYLPML